MNEPLVQTDLPFPKRQGKVRDCYDLGDSMLIVSTDRISAFDYILPNGIPDKGRILTQLSRFWFENLGVKHHMLSTDVPPDVRKYDPNGLLVGRVMEVRKATVIPFECVVRGYLEGSGWRDYQSSGKICEIPLPAGLQQCAQLSNPIFTPTTKAEAGHDESVSFNAIEKYLGIPLANSLRERSLHVYQKGAQIAAEKGILIADTKFEWGWHQDEVILIDEVLTPDSSRFWPASSYQPGQAQQSFDKQFVREYLMSTDWDRNSPPPSLPESIIDKTRQKYIDVYERLTGNRFAF
ncbi:MAG: phosphoribosylaminoimidazolesuccinocarboxamide synthase [Pirellulaceae bacterium]|nr:phosphoribosylaminoimidazolesuccinocarboxamide synthase [Pirellulaceae bacterium]